MSVSSARLLYLTSAWLLVAVSGGRAISAEGLYPSVGYRTASEQKIAVGLDQPVRDFDFVDMSLGQMTHFLADVHKMPIIVDKSALESVNFDPSTPVNASFRDISLRSALRHSLQPLGLTYAIRDEVLLITTETSPNAIEVRCYHVGELLREGESSGELAHAVSQTLDISMSGHPAKGGVGFGAAPDEGRPGAAAAARRRLVTFGDILIVRDTDSGHEQIARALASMRDAFRLSERQQSTRSSATAAPAEADELFPR